VKIRHKVDYRRARAQAYPDIGEQLDAIWKAIGALQSGKKAPADAAAITEQIDAVKAKFRKD
jgi:hypothetical protein